MIISSRRRWYSERGRGAAAAHVPRRQVTAAPRGLCRALAPAAPRPASAAPRVAPALPARLTAPSPPATRRLERSRTFSKVSERSRTFSSRDVGEQGRTRRPARTVLLVNTSEVTIGWYGAPRKRLTSTVFEYSFKKCAKFCGILKFYESQVIVK